MNLLLQDPQEKLEDYPTSLSHDLVVPYSGVRAMVLSFNRTGTYLAVGYSDGWVNVWDCMTWGIADHFQAHHSAITSIGPVLEPPDFSPSLSWHARTTPRPAECAAAPTAAAAGGERRGSGGFAAGSSEAAGC